MTASWDLGLVPCGSAKNPAAVTARSLYTGGHFKAAMTHATQRCGAVLIMSAKYGLLRPEDCVAYYEAYLPTLDAKARANLTATMCKQVEWLPTDSRILSYLPRAYADFLDRVLKLAGREDLVIRRPYGNLSMIMQITVLRAETRNYGSLPARR